MVNRGHFCTAAVGVVLAFIASAPATAQQQPEYTFAELAEFARSLPGRDLRSKSAKHFRDGLELARQGQLEAARGEFLRALEFYPRADWVAIELGLLELATGDGNAARQAFERARMLEAQRTEFYIRLPSQWGNLTEAETEAVMDYYTAGGTPIYRLEIAFAGFTRDAAAVAEQCHRDSPAMRSVAETFIGELVASSDPARRDQGMWLFETWIEACPTDWFMVQSYGQTLVNQREFERAGPYLAHAYRNLRERHRENGYSNPDEFVALYQTHQYREAFEYALDHARNRLPTTEAFYVAAQSAFHLDRYREQIALAARAAELNSEALNDGVLLRLGIAHAALGDHAAALAHLDGAVALNPADEVTRQWRLVAVYAAQGREQAIEAGAAQGLWRSNVLELAYLGTFDFAERSERAGNHYTALGNYALALRALRDFYRGSSIGTDQTIDEAGRLSARISAIRQALPVEPAIAPEALPFVRQAEEAARRRDAVAAATAYEEAVARSPWSAELRYNHALALGGQSLNDLPWAIEEMQQFFALAPGDPKASEGQRLIVTWQGMIDRAVAACGGRVTRDPVRTKGIAAPQLVLPALESC